MWFAAVEAHRPVGHLAAFYRLVYDCTAANPPRYVGYWRRCRYGGIFAAGHIVNSDGFAVLESIKPNTQFAVRAVEILSGGCRHRGGGGPDG